MYLILNLRVGPALPFPAARPTSNLPFQHFLDFLKQLTLIE
jgi:hypothetical protein